MSSLPTAGAAEILYSTYFGGPLGEGAYATTVDREGNIYFAGATINAKGFPVTNAVQKANAGKTDAYVCKLSPTGQILFSTFLGGSGDDEANAIAIAPDGGMIVVGFTRSVDFPTTDDSIQLEYAGGTAFGRGDGFLAKLSNDGQMLVYATYFGGSGDDSINGIGVDSSGNVVVTGTTASRNLPRRNAIQATYGGGEKDIFLAKFERSLGSLTFSTYLGGSAAEENPAIALDVRDNVYVAGDTLSTNFPVTPGAFQTNHITITNIKTGSMNGFITKFAPDGTAHSYSSYFMPGTAIYGVTVDVMGNAYITGESHIGFSSDDIPLGFQPNPTKGKGEAFLAKVKPDGAKIDWFSYLGGSGGESAFSIALDRKGDIYVCGITDSTDFPVRNGIQSKFQGGDWDAFLSKVSGDGKSLLYSTYLGGANEDWGYGVTVDKDGNVIFVGQTSSRNFPTMLPVQAGYAGTAGSLDFDAFVTKISSAVTSPPIQIAITGQNVVLTWPGAFSGFTLEESITTGGPFIWHNVVRRPVVIGGQNTVIMPVNIGARLYRLHSP